MKVAILRHQQGMEAKVIRVRIPDLAVLSEKLRIKYGIWPTKADNRECDQEQDHMEGYARNTARLLGQSGTLNPRRPSRGRTRQHWTVLQCVSSGHCRAKTGCESRIPLRDLRMTRVPVPQLRAAWYQAFQQK